MAEVHRGGVVEVGVEDLGGPGGMGPPAREDEGGCSEGAVAGDQGDTEGLHEEGEGEATTAMAITGKNV